MKWWFRRKKKQEAQVETDAPAPDDQPAGDETPTGQIPALGAADIEADVDDLPEAGSYPNSAKPLADGSAPSAEFTIKGNAGSMLFHTKESPYYSRTKAEVWFRTAEDAEAAGFTGWNKRRSASKVAAGPYPGSALPVAGGDAPAADFIVKGNADSMLYHTKESPFFGVTTAEVWFKSTADAEKAGFHAWKS